MIPKTPGVRSLLYSGDLLAVDFGSFALKILALKAKEHSLTVHSMARRELWNELSSAVSEDEKRDIYAGGPWSAR